MSRNSRHNIYIFRKKFRIRQLTQSRHLVGISRRQQKIILTICNNTYLLHWRVDIFSNQEKTARTGHHDTSAAAALLQKEYSWYAMSHEWSYM